MIVRFYSWEISHFILQVSWLRKRDQSILAVDDSVFVTDERFRAFYVDHTETWTLHIRGVTSDDAGIYECQLSTTPKLSRFIHVHVVGEFLCSFIDFR